MPRKKRKSAGFRLTTGQRDVIIGVALVFAALVAFFSNTESAAGRLLIPVFEYLYGPQYRWLFSVSTGLLGILLALGRVGWSSVRALGLLLFWISSVSLVSYLEPGIVVGIFDLHRVFGGWFGDIAAGFLLSVLLLFSLVLAYDIHPRTLVSIAGSAIPSPGDLIPDIGASSSAPVKTGTKSAPLGVQKSAHESRMQDLEREIEALRKAKNVPDTPSTQIKKPVSEMKIPVERADTQTSKNDNAGQKPVWKTQKPATEISESNAKPAPDFGVWDFPSSELLTQGRDGHPVDMDEVRRKSYEIERALLQFRVEVEMAGQKIGPTVIQYRLKPAEGVKLSRIENLKKDLTLALRAKSVRIQAPIPGLGLVGVEVPNDERQTVRIREVIESREFQHHKSNLALIVGKNINGDFIVWDLAKMPHLLIAWQTGSGKSVGMNGFLVSLLYKNSPSDLRMIMVDPKRVELGIYHGIPHLLAPVITDADKALNALKWSVTEMLSRYDLLQKQRARNIAEYNRKVTKKDRLPNIVIVIDELADLMMSGNKKEVEMSIARIAQMARAVGMHLVIATQRPSVDVITGLIKANIPSRIAFTVASLVDSRTILDRAGAEDLLGYGDMLYAPSGSLAPERIQGVLVETEEVESIVHHVRRTIDPAMLEELYDESITMGEKSWVSGAQGGEHDEDPAIIEEATRLVRESWKASTSMLQRRMKLGYARAARVMDILEELGVVGPADGSKPREVL